MTTPRTSTRSRYTEADKALDELGGYPLTDEAIRAAGYRPFAEAEVGTGVRYEMLLLDPDRNPLWMSTCFAVAVSGQLAFQRGTKQSEWYLVEPLLTCGGEVWLRERRS